MSHRQAWYRSHTAAASSFAPLRGVADENGEQVAIMLVGLDQIIRRIADNASEGDQKLNENADKIGLGMRSQSLHKIASEPVIRSFIHDRPWLRSGAVPVLPSSLSGVCCWMNAWQKSIAHRPARCRRFRPSLARHRPSLAKLRRAILDARSGRSLVFPERSAVAFRKRSRASAPLRPTNTRRQLAISSATAVEISMSSEIKAPPRWLPGSSRLNA